MHTDYIYIYPSSISLFHIVLLARVIVKIYQQGIQHSLISFDDRQKDPPACGPFECVILGEFPVAQALESRIWGRGPKMKMWTGSKARTSQWFNLYSKPQTCVVKTGLTTSSFQSPGMYHVGLSPSQTSAEMGPKVHETLVVQK